MFDQRERLPDRPAAPGRRPAAMVDPRLARGSSISGWILLGVALAAAGALLGAPGLVLLGALTILSRWITTLWSRYGLHGIDYRRRLGSDRAIWGDRVPLDIEVWNRKLLPLPRLQADDHVTDSLRVIGRSLGPSDHPGLGSLSNTWSLLSFERVMRHLQIDARRRGTFEFGPVRLTVSDLFERGSNDEERDLPATLIVRPRSVPVRIVEPARAPLGTTRSRHSLFHDAARFAGVRPYQVGDPIRRIHWRASGRLGGTVVKRFEPVHERSVLLVPDVQTVDGPHWLMVYDDDQLESLCVAAASLARRLLAEGAGCGLLVGAQLSGGRRWAWMPPVTAHGQLGRIEDTLARIQPIVTLPFSSLLRVIPRRLAPGATVITLGTRPVGAYLEGLRRLRRSGYRAEHMALGPVARASRDRLAGNALHARAAHLEPDWQTADALVLGD